MRNRCAHHDDDGNKKKTAARVPLVSQMPRRGKEASWHLPQSCARAVTTDGVVHSCLTHEHRHWYRRWYRARALWNGDHGAASRRGQQARPGAACWQQASAELCAVAVRTARCERRIRLACARMGQGALKPWPALSPAKKLEKCLCATLFRLLSG